MNGENDKEYTLIEEMFLSCTHLCLLFSLAIPLSMFVKYGETVLKNGEQSVIISL